MPPAVIGGGLGTQKAWTLGGGEVRALHLSFPVKFGSEGRGGVRGVTVAPVREPGGRGLWSAHQQASPRKGEIRANGGKAFRKWQCGKGAGSPPAGLARCGVRVENLPRGSGRGSDLPGAGVQQPGPG